MRALTVHCAVTEWQPRRRSSRATPGPTAMFKEYRSGRQNPSILHRSPAISSTGEQRLALVIDTAHEINQPPGRELHQHELKYEMFGPSKYHRLALDR
ncbi:DUF1826 domain-containing protein [Sinorhizobium arboris]|uniref:DUF1826 domain-containing protein n=1 Tax=Sinorhizobium arboris TaxID=76745 RepID=UPI003B003193